MKHRFYLYVKALSDLGSAMDTIVLGALIYSVTHSAGWLAASMCMGVLGGLFTSLSSGVLADQLNRRKIMIISDWLRAGFILLLIPFPNPIMILIVRFISGGLTSFFAVSFSAEVPQIYGEKNVVSINALTYLRKKSPASISGEMNYALDEGGVFLPLSQV
jgi:MFS family permease